MCMYNFRMLIVTISGYAKLFNLTTKSLQYVG